MAESLGSSRIGAPASADAYFRRDLGLLVGQPSSCWCPCLPIMIIPEGYNALVTRCGAEIMDSNGSVVHKPGCMVVSPFTSVSHLVTKAHCVFNAPVKGCKTSDNVQVNINVAVIFRIVNSGAGGVRYFVHEVTPGGLEQQLKDSIAQELRALARSMKHTEVYACRTGLPSVPGEAVDDDVEPSKVLAGETGKAGALPPLTVEATMATKEEVVRTKGIDVTEEMKVKVNSTLDDCVEIIDISITDVELPQQIAEQMTSRTLVKSKQMYEVMEQKFEMQKIRLGNEVEQSKLNNHEKEEKQRTIGAKDVQSLRDELKEKRTRHARVEAEFAEQTEAEVNKIKAATTEQAKALSLEKARVLDPLKLSAEEEAELAEAQASAEVEKLRADTRSTVARNRGEAETKVAEAEERANKKLEKKRELDVIDKRLDVYEALANNPQVVVSDSSDAEHTRLLVSDSVLAANAGQYETDQDLVARLNVLRLASNALGMRSEWTAGAVRSHRMDRPRSPRGADG